MTNRQASLHHSLLQLAPEPNLIKQMCPSPCHEEALTPREMYSFKCDTALASPSHIPAPLGAMPPLRLCQGAGGTSIPPGLKPQHLLPLDLCHRPVSSFSYPPPITVISILTLTPSPGIWEQRPFPGVHPPGYPARGNHGWLL